MMRSHRLRRLWGTAIVALAGLVLALRVERGTEQRANRLERTGEYAEAVGLYGSLVTAEGAGDEGVPDRLRYNFASALLDMGNLRAETELARVATSADSSLRVRALYNRGLWHLLRARDSRMIDSVRAHADISVAANKDALRLEPGRVDARWNLALAQRMLDSVNSEGGPAGNESADGASDSDDRVLSDELREFENESEITNASREGSDEALAAGQEAAPLDALAADEILVTEADRSIIVRKLLTYEGRVQRRVRVGRNAPRW
jgi:hypothetical protein